MVSCAWDFGDGDSSSETNPVHAYAEGTYTAVVTITDDEGATNSATVGVNVALRIQEGEQHGAIQWYGSLQHDYSVLTATELNGEWTVVSDPVWSNRPGLGAFLVYTNAYPDDKTRFFRVISTPVP